MRTRANIIVTDLKFQTVPIEELTVQDECLLAIDGSTTITGASLIRIKDSALIATMRFDRETETAVKYKVLLKRELLKLLLNNKQITKIFYEEPFIGYKESAETLLMLRTSVEELQFENEPNLDHIKYAEVNNQRYKKQFLAPTKIPKGTDNQKKALKEKLLWHLPILGLQEYDISQDEIDATALGLVASWNIKHGTDDELETVKSRPFAFEMKFICADNDDIMLQEMFDLGVPKEVLENGIKMQELKKSTNLNKQVYTNMGTTDKLLIFWFNSNKHSNLILQHNLAEKAQQHEKIYILAYRKNRKK